MADRFYPTSTTIEGRTYSGNWTLKQAGRLCVAWPNGSRIVDLGPGETPEKLASLVLKQLIESWLEEQRRPPPKPPQLRKSRRAAQAPEAEEEGDRAALRKLVAEIAAGDYRDQHGHSLVQNTAYLEAVALLDLEDYLERQH